jgi:hypothetical protein
MTSAVLQTPCDHRLGLGDRQADIPARAHKFAARRGSVEQVEGNDAASEPRRGP